jgi:hypothetical protein
MFWSWPAPLPLRQRAVPGVNRTSGLIGTTAKGRFDAFAQPTRTTDFALLPLPTVSTLNGRWASALLGSDVHQIGSD